VVFRGVASQVVDLEELLAAAELRTFEVLDLLVDASDVTFHGVHVAEGLVAQMAADSISLFVDKSVREKRGKKELFFLKWLTQFHWFQ
jgi:hypothetical protein